MDCLHTLFKYGFTGKTVAKSVQVFDNVQKPVYFSQRRREGTKCPALEKNFVDEKVQKVVFKLSAKDKINSEKWHLQKK